MGAELQVAAWRGDADAVLTFITRQGSLQPATVCSYDRFGCSPLHLAALGGSADAVDALVDLQADINAQASASLGGVSPLMLAALRGPAASPAAMALLNAGADPDIVAAGGLHVAHLAAWSGAHQLMQRLLSRQPSCACMMHDQGLRALDFAALSGQVEVVAMLMEGSGLAAAQCAAPDGNVLPTLHCAALGGDGESTALILRGMPEQASVRVAGWLPLHFAAAVGSHPALAALLTAQTVAQADVNAVDSDGLTPLHLACAGGHTECVQLLLSASARLDSEKSIFGCSLFSFAALTVAGGQGVEEGGEEGAADCLRELVRSIGKMDAVEEVALIRLVRELKGEAAAAAVAAALA